MNVAIVEDDSQAAETLKRYFSNYAEQHQQKINVITYGDPVEFLSCYRANFDVLVLDIQMPGINGMRLAERIRSQDAEVIIVFVTSMAKYAVDGYKVGAIDFLLKPVSYFEFSKMLDKVLRGLARRELPSVMVNMKREIRRLPAASIHYIEVQDHRLYIHMDDGDVVEAWMSLAQIERVLPAAMFSKINVGVLVNLNAILGVRNEQVILPNAALPLSRRRKKELCKELAFYFGENSHV